MKPIQNELGNAAEVFNLAVQTGTDPDRVLRDKLTAAMSREAAREYELKMQRVFSQCPGFIGGDVPEGERSKGHVIVSPALSLEARAWLKKRFHVSDTLEPAPGDGLRIEVMPRVRRSSTGPRRVKVSFAPVEQFALAL